jgi:hypothetical protein
VERVNSRLDTSFGLEKHTIRGLTKMYTRCCLALVVMLAMAVGRIKANQACPFGKDAESTARCGGPGRPREARDANSGWLRCGGRLNGIVPGEPAFDALGNFSGVSFHVC